MSKRAVVGVVAVVYALLGAFLGQRAEVARAQEPKGPRWVHGIDLEARPAGKESWKDAKKYGVEVFRDENNGYLVYITNDGRIAVAPGKDGAPQESKGAKFIHSNDLGARPAGKESWKDAKQYGVEIFRDENNGHLVYITSDGRLSVLPSKDGAPAESKGPKWVHGLELGVRPAGEESWKKAGKVSVEVFRDGSNGNLEYITEGGQVAVVPGKDTPAEAKAPKWIQGLDLKARTAGELGWDRARKYGVEVYRDENNGSLVYITKDGEIAVVPGKDGPLEAKAPRWVHGLDLKARPAGEASWDKARKYGIEVFKDEGTGNLVYITQDGHIAAVPAK